ncbi:MAG: hypothetical protein IPH75_11975 [bacterium]|nr:hypothetical protein [bacterium]
MKRPGRTLLFILVGELLILLNWQFPVIRFSVQWANDLCLLQTLLAPAVLIYILAKHKEMLTNFRFLRPTVMVAGTIIAALSFVLAGMILLGGLLLGSETMDKQCEAMEVFAHSSVKAYRFSSNLPPPRRYMVRQEMTLIPGILLVRELEHGVLDSNAETFCEDLRERMSGRTDLKPYVYF